MDTTLVIMAAGLGSRYGGLKQIEPVGMNSELLMEFAIYDALRAGFSRVVCVIKPENEPDFRAFFKKLPVQVDYVHQTCPADRAKPWGTGHAVLCCRDAVNEPFCVINADDFYGAQSYEACRGFLEENAGSPDAYCMAGFRALNTLTEHGTVSRGICVTDSNNYLTAINERVKLKRENGVITDLATGITVPDGAFASMNLWGFPRGFFDELAPLFNEFLQNAGSGRQASEFYLPSAVDTLIKRERARVKVLPVDSKWYGMTYREDKAALVEAISDMTNAGIYPEKLW